MSCLLLLNPFLFSSFINPPHLTQLTVSKEETEGLFVIKGENYVRKKAHKVNAVSLHYSASGGGGGRVKRCLRSIFFHCSNGVNLCFLSL